MMVPALMVLWALVASIALGTGPAGIPLGKAVLACLDHLPLLNVHSGLTASQDAIVWQLRAPRIALASIVGATLAASGAVYQGVFRNDLADPYLLGVASGAGLGATLAIVGGATSFAAPAAFAGGIGAVAVAFAVSSSKRSPGGSSDLLLAGVAIAYLLTAVQTFVQQRHTDVIREVYSWILGRLTVATWDDVARVLPYVLVSWALIVVFRRVLDVMAVGDEEATALGLPVARCRVLLIGAATLGAAAVVSVSGLIGFVGLVVPHIVRLVSGGSYKTVVPMSFVGGAIFLLLADQIARTVASPAEVPVGVVTAFAGGPFFLVLLRTRSRWS